MITADQIKQNVVQLQSKNATPQDIESYVSSASQELQQTSRATELSQQQDPNAHLQNVVKQFASPPPQTGLAGLGQGMNNLPDIGKAIGDEFSGTGNRLNATNATLTGQFSQTDVNQRAGTIGAGEALVQNAGNAANAAVNTVFDLPVIHGLASLVGKGVEGIKNANQYIIQKIWGMIPQNVKDSASGAAQNALSGVSDQALGITPEKAQAIKDTTNAALGFVNSGMLAEGLTEGAKTLQQHAPAILQGVSDLATKAKDTVGNVVDKVQANSQAKAAAKAPEVTGQILQGEKSDIPAGQRVLSSLNPKQIKTYADARTALDESVKTQSSQIDKAYETNSKATKINDMWSKQGDVTTNYVKDAIQQLKDQFTKTNNAKGLNDVIQLEKKGNSEGLTSKDLNDLAKMHGNNLNAYNANGELASGLKKQAAEATRAGTKTTAREMSGNPKQMKAADAQLADTIKTRDLMKTMEEKVNTAQQKIKSISWGRKLGAKVTQAFDILTGHALKGAADYLTKGGARPESMNSLELQKSLSKNLAKLQKLSDGNLSESEASKALQDIIDSNKINPQTGTPYDRSFE